jgi:hypothetical protein
MFLRRIFKGMPDLGPWVSVAELFAAVATLVATLMALGVVNSPFSTPTGKITGTVTDVKTGKPVPEANVQIIENTSRVTTTELAPDAKGNWSDSVKPGSYLVKAVCDGYRPCGKNVSVIQGKTRIVRLEIAPQTREEAQAAGSSAVPVTTVETRIVKTVATSGGGDGASERSSSSGAASAPVQSASSQGADNPQVGKLLAAAKKLNNDGKQDAAIDKLAEASSLDAADGRPYALAIQIRVSQGNFQDAKDWYKDGVKYAKRHADQVEQAGSLLQ